MELITPETVYWITRLDNICSFFRAFTFIFTALAIVLTIVYFAIKLDPSFDEEEKFPKWPAITSSILMFPCIMGTIFTPTTKEMCAILVIPKIANNESVQELGTNIVDLANDWLKELSPQQSNPNETIKDNVQDMIKSRTD